MGASYIDLTIEACDENTLKQKYSDFEKDSSYQYGNDAYSGTLKYGVRICIKTFKTSEEAEEWVSENQQKWGPSYAVKIGDFNKAFYNTAKGKKLTSVVNDLKFKVTNFDKDLLQKLSTQKSQYKGCTHCGSKISVKHFVRGKETTCPVCHGELVKSQKDIDTFKKLTIQLNEKTKELTVLQQTHNTKLGKNKPYWYIGGWASC